MQPGTEPNALFVLLAGAAAAGAALLTFVLAMGNRPRTPTPGEPTMDLRTEPPAVVDLLTDDFELTRASIPATLLDLAARGWAEIEEPAPGHVQVRLSSGGEGELTRYERRLLRHLRGLEVRGVIPAEVLTTGPEEASEGWWRGFEREVIKDARRRGLCRRRWTLGRLALIWAAVIGAGVLLYLSVSLGDRPPGASRTIVEPTPGFVAAAAGVAIMFLVAGRYSRSTRQRDADEGLEVAGYWLGVRRYLDETGDFSDKPAASVVLWERYLGYAAAMDLAPTAVRQLPLGAESDRQAWSKVTGQWRRVRVRYPRLRPAWGSTPWGALLTAGIRGAVTGAITWFAYRASREELDVVADLDPEIRRWVTLGALVIAVVFLLITLWQLLIVVLAVPDLFGRRTVEGVVLRQRLRRTGDWLPGIVQKLYYRRHDQHGQPIHRKERRYIAVDDGDSRSVTAWRVDPRIYSRSGQGARVRVVVTPLLGNVRSLEVLEPPARREAAPMSEVAEQIVGKATGAAGKMLGRAETQMERLEGMRDEEGRPILDRTDEEGVPLRDRLAQAREMLGRMPGFPAEEDDEG